MDSWQVLGWRVYYDYAMSENWFDEIGKQKFEAVFYANAVEMMRFVSMKNGRIN